MRLQQSISHPLFSPLLFFGTLTMRHVIMWFLQKKEGWRRRLNHNPGSSTLQEEEEEPSFDLPTIATTNMVASDNDDPQQQQQQQQQQQRQQEHGGGTRMQADNNNMSNTTSGVSSHHHHHHHHLPLLYTLAKSWAWQAVSFRCRTHPHEASAEFVDQRGDNALHWVAFGNPTADVVRELLRACPQLAHQPNQRGFYPLHVASSYRARATVIQLILEAFPEAAGLSTRTGMTVLHLMCDYGTTPEALQHVLGTRESVATVTIPDALLYHRKPLHILNGRKNMGACQRARDAMRRLRQKIGQTTLKTTASGDGGGNDGNPNNNDSDICRLRQLLLEFAQDDTWKKASMLLVVEANGQPLLSESDHVVVDPIQILHAAIQVPDCPASFQEWAILLYSELLAIPAPNDDDGRVPLHVAAERHDTALLLDLLQACPSAAAVRNAAGDLPLQTLLLRRNTTTTTTNDDPSVLRHWKDGIGALIQAHPPAMEELDLPDAAYPLIWSKLSSSSSRESLFQAIRSCPRSFVKGTSSKT